MTANPPAQEQPAAPAPAAANPPVAAVTNKYSAANDLMFEDCLKSIMLKSKTGKTYCPYKNKYCPKAMQSPFGDFPPEYLPKKTFTKSDAPSEAGFSMMSSTSMHSISATLCHNA
jgi:hypothetical protein